MDKETEQNYFNKIDKVVDDYFAKKLNEIADSINQIDGSKVDCETLDIVSEANSWLQHYAEMSQQPELYEHFRFHVFIVDDTLMVIQGPEVNTDPGKEI